MCYRIVLKIIREAIWQDQIRLSKKWQKIPALKKLHAQNGNNSGKPFGKSSVGTTVLLCRALN